MAHRMARRLGILRLACRLLVLKALMMGVLALALVVHGSNEGFWNFEVRWPRSGGPMFAGHFATWDAAHYFLLAEEGYRRDLPSCAFPPLWPWVIRWGRACGVPLPWAGLAAAHVLSALGLALFHDIARQECGDRAARWALAIACAYPGAMFFGVPYSEGLFLLLLVVLLASMREGWLATAWGAALLLPLCRSAGVFVVVPLAWEVARSCRGWQWLARTADLAPRERIRGFGKGRVGWHPERGSWWWWLLPMAPAMGWCAGLACLWTWTGDPLEGIHAQRHWGRHTVENLVNLPRFMEEMLQPTCWHGFSGSVLDRVMFVGLAYTMPWMWRRSRGWTLWAVALGVLPAMSGGFTSFTRYGSVVIPMFWVWGEGLARAGGVGWKGWVVAGLACMQAVLLWRHVNYAWAG